MFPCRFCIFLTYQLKNWLRVQGVAPKLYCFGQRVLPKLVSLCITSLSLRIVGVFWIFFFFLMRRVSPAAFPLTRQGMHPVVALEKSTLSGFTEAIGIPGLLDAIGLDAEEVLVAKEEDRFIAAGRDLDTTLSSSFYSCILFAIVEQLIKLKPLVQQVELKWLIFNK